ncbi:NADPH-dependent FMN reductase [Demequina sp.]|uniref:NADPH-dependent FMN reductase n=1 Tax=Demequina sp. TaxID=2050685 RepID=UPI003D13F5C2
MPHKLAIIIGSTRPGRVGPSVAEWFVNAARDHGAFDITLVDLKDLDLPLLDEAAHPSKQQYEHEHTKRWSAIVEDADAFVFVTPEYDYFAPAALVNAVQCLAKEWQYKPAGVVSYGGVSGGLRSTQTLRLLLANLDMHPLKDSVSVQFVAKHITEGVFTPPEHAPGAAATMLDELEKWTGALSSLRS